MLQDSPQEAYLSQRARTGIGKGTFEPSSYRVDELLRSLACEMAESSVKPVDPHDISGSFSQSTQEMLESSQTFIGRLPTMNPTEQEKFLRLTIHDDYDLEGNNVVDQRDWRFHLRAEQSVPLNEIERLYEVVRKRPEIARYEDGTEEPVERNLERMAERIWPLVAVTIIQLWVDELAAMQCNNDVGLEFREALKVLALARVRTSQSLGTSRRVIADVTLSLKEEEDLDHLLSVDAKKTAIRLRQYLGENGVKKTGDEFLSETLPPPAPDKTMVVPLNNLWMAYGIKAPTGWQAKSLNIIAQMICQAQGVDSRMVLFTSIYGFARIGYLMPWNNDEAQVVPISMAGCRKRLEKTKRFIFLLSDNIMQPYNDDAGLRQKPATNYAFLRFYYLFVLHAFLSSQGEMILPPGQRKDYYWLQIPQPEILVEILLSIWTQLLAQKIQRFKMPHFVGEFYALETRQGPDWLAIPYLRFDELEEKESEGRQIFVNRRAGIILKCFKYSEDFDQEHRIYRSLSTGRPAFVPPYYGSFKNPGAGVQALMIGYMGISLRDEIKEDILRYEDLLKIRLAVLNLHALGIHHHDIKPDNLIRDKYGRIILTDFGNARFVKPGAECNGCLDFRWYIAVNIVPYGLATP
ncbi:hypothetical protein CPB83DRAFT_840853 [Crepidotus variabilis]|uniref:Protein kinase domain-containing protein n=1 Tax=Crepidotus variabilis TaxID=179855 RepID=A0A9P6E3N0_9AGAR|nr:hypothetical protein CPB83DRAFT_840853 [Crepidotus variabilis]